MIRTVTAIATGLLLASSVVAAAQDYTLPPTAAMIKLTAGFSPDPHEAAVVPGGAVNAAKTIEGCFGFVSEAPNLRLFYTPGDVPLIFQVGAAVDTTLLVRAPDGQWLCDDDTGGDLNPRLALAAPLSGQYDIWVGTYGPAAAAQATLFVTAAAGPALVDIGRPPGAGVVDRSLPPLFGETELVAGFAAHPHEVPVNVNYDVADAGLGEDCRGYVTAAPTYRLSYLNAGFVLTIAARSEVDMTLIVIDPAGNVRCDDDSGDGSNPAITFDYPLDGTYDIWVGLYSAAQGAPVPATLAISEGTVGPLGGPYLDMTLRPTAGSARLVAGSMADPFQVPLTAGGEIDARSAVADACRGYMGPAPSFIFFYSGPRGPLSIWADSADDTTLVVNTPTGDWFRNDDGGVGEIPAIRWDDALPGLYHVWVGTYRLPPEAATLNISRTVNPIDPTPDPPEFMKIPGG